MTQKVKGFFERPEGKTGLIFIGIASFGAFVLFGNVILPFVISALQNTIHAAILGGTVLGGAYLIMNQKFRFLVSNMFKSAMRFITGMFITIDPIGILKNYIETMEDKIRGIELNIGKLSAQKRNIFENIERSKKEREDNLHLANSAKKQGKDHESILYARKASRADDAAKNFENIHEKMENIYKILDRMKKAVNFLLEDTKDEVRVKEIEYKSIKAAHKAMTSASDLINGSSERDLFEQSMEYLATDIGMKLGEMDRFMDLSENFLSGVDIQNGAWDEKGLDLLSKWEKEATILSYEEKKLHAPNKTPVVVVAENSYSSLFKS